MGPTIGPIPPNHNPWTELQRIADELRLATAPPDEAVLARCDIALLLEATTRARAALAQPSSRQQRAVAALLAALDKTLRGLAAELRLAEEAARELLSDVSRMRAG